MDNSNAASPGLQGDVAVEHPAVVKLRLVCAGTGVRPLAALAGLAPRRHGLPLEADLGVGRRTGTSASMGGRRWRGQRAKSKLTTWTAGQLCTERQGGWGGQWIEKRETREGEKKNHMG